MADKEIENIMNEIESKYLSGLSSIDVESILTSLLIKFYFNGYFHLKQNTSPQDFILCSIDILYKNIIKNFLETVFTYESPQNKVN
jgi:hypothetical protein